MTSSTNPAMDEVPEPRFRVQRLFSGTRTRGWQVLRDDQPISGFFDERSDAVAAMIEFRAEARAALGDRP